MNEIQLTINVDSRSNKWLQVYTVNIAVFALSADKQTQF